MKKVLRVISVSAGIVSMVSAIILTYIYLEDIAGRLEKLKQELKRI